MYMGLTMMAVFWVVAPCSLVEVYRRFRGPCCLHHGPDDQKTAIFVLTAVRTSNDVRKTEMNTAEPLVHESSSFEVEVSTEKLKR
jgi:hypothetical protein